MPKEIGGFGNAPKASRDLMGRDGVESLENIPSAVRLLKAGNASRPQQTQAPVVLRVLVPVRLYEPIFAGADN